MLHLKSVSDQENYRHLQRHKLIQNKKLFHLSQESHQASTIKRDDVIFNHSRRALTEQEKNLLVKGLNFFISPKKLNYCDVLIPFELLYRKIFHDPIYSTSGVNADFLKTRTKDIALSGFRIYRCPNSVFSEDDLRILKIFKDNPNIVIIKPDKGNGLVILDKSDYN